MFKIVCKYIMEFEWYLKIISKCLRSNNKNKIYLWGFWEDVLSYMEESSWMYWENIVLKRFWWFIFY